MSGSLSRSVSMSPVEAAPPLQLPINMSSSPPKSTGILDGRRIQDVGSPLKIFVLAKKKINDIFAGIQEYVDESSRFLNELDDTEIIEKSEVDEISKHSRKISGIREVLMRDHMKVVFFGRTSNGKSTVINAMLQDKILPSGLGHTTNCFLQIEGSDSDEAYLLAEDSKEQQNVSSVGQLANALNCEKLGDSALVRIFWPKEKCPLLRDDVVLVDSPGIDVSPNLDEWIDKHCVDADVFVLVANAESTLMLTEKNFFHKVSEKLSKPNIFVLNNRWDASANEPEYLEQVRKQHMTRNVSFLVDELNVVTRQQAEDRVFFISAREALHARTQQQKGLPPHSAALADGFQNRYFEFQDFERKFEECLSKSAVKTKFEQHSQRGQSIINELRSVLDNIHVKASELVQVRKNQRKEQWDRLEFTQQQLYLLSSEVKHQLHALSEQVEQRVSNALNEEIRRLALVVNEFDRPFHPDNLVISVYKKELHKYVEDGLGSNLRGRLSNSIASCVENTQKEMIERMLSLIPLEHKGQTPSVTPRHNFEILYRLNCESLCSDFQEDLEFRFTFSLTQLLRNMLGPRASRIMLSEQAARPIASTPQTPSNDVKPILPPSPDYLAIVQKVAVVSPTSQTAVGALALSGFMVRTIGWRIIAVTAGIYGVLYLYERLTWTNKAKERAFKKQYVKHTTHKLRLVVDLTSANCSHQVQQELTSTFANLCHIVEDILSEMTKEITRLDKEIEKLENAASSSRILKNKAVYLTKALETFAEQYLMF